MIRSNLYVIKLQKNNMRAQACGLSRISKLKIVSKILIINWKHLRTIRSQLVLLADKSKGRYDFLVLLILL